MKKVYFSPLENGLKPASILVAGTGLARSFAEESGAHE